VPLVEASELGNSWLKPPPTRSAEDCSVGSHLPRRTTDRHETT
jgi:hypothetical protein